jgi:PAS domain S-box-containing protein
VLGRVSEDALVVLERMDEGYYAIDRSFRLLYVNAGAELFWGRDRGELLGRTMLELFPRFEGSDSWAAHVRAFETGAPVRAETISTATGAPVEVRIFPTDSGATVYFRDITDRRRLEQDLRTRHELLTLAELSAGIGVWVGDLASGTVVATPQFFHLIGLEPIDGPFSADLPRSVRHPEDRERVAEGFREAIARGDETYDSEYRIVRPSGEVRWIFGRGRVSRDAEGRPWRYAGVDIDITERKKQEDHLHVVVGEMIHRTNNLLAVVDAMARQTAKTSDGLELFVPAFLSRLKGLGQSSSLLAREEWRGVPLDELIRAQLGIFVSADRLALSGPHLQLSPKAAQNLGLALHELATNAIKYGALSRPSGSVDVTWHVTEGGLDLFWKERGGPPVTQPTRAGFGRVVSEQMLGTALGAKVTTTFATDGLEWRLILPSSEFTNTVG